MVYQVVYDVVVYLVEVDYVKLYFVMFLIQCFIECCMECGEFFCEFVFEVYVQGVMVVFGQYVEIVVCLCCFDYVEVGFLVGYCKIFGVVGGDLEEDVVVRFIFVGLVCGVQEVWVEFGVGCDMLFFVYFQLYCLYCIDCCFVVCDVVEQGDVIVIV